MAVAMIDGTLCVMMAGAIFRRKMAAAMIDGTLVLTTDGPVGTTSD
jgi:hypothetical protein